MDARDKWNKRIYRRYFTAMCLITMFIISAAVIETPAKAQSQSSGELKTPVQQTQPPSIAPEAQKPGLAEQSPRRKPGSSLFKPRQKEENECNRIFWQGEKGPAEEDRTFCLGAVGCNNADVEQRVNEEFCRSTRCNKQNEACSPHKCEWQVRSSSLTATCTQKAEHCDKRDDGVSGTGNLCVCHISIPKNTAVNCGCGCS
jgi:hypothetical protein